MNVATLVDKVAEMLNVNAEEKDRAFSIFKENIASSLNVGEALKLSGIGIFQLKERVGHLDSKPIIASASKDLTLVFSPEASGTGGESLFLNLELGKSIKDESEFDESVFQLGVDKPLITSTEVQSDEKDSYKKDKEIEDSVKEIISHGERIDKFDIWEDYLKTKESKNIIEELGEEETKIKSNVEEEFITDKDFVELNEDEVFEDILENGDFIEDEVTNEKSDNLRELDDILEEATEESFENSLEEIIEDGPSEISIEEVIDNETSEEELTEEIIPDSLDVDESIDNSTESTILDEIDLELEGDYEDSAIETQDENKDEVLEGKNEEISEDISDEPMAETSTDIDEETVVSEENENFESNDNIKKKRSPLLYLIVVSFITLAAIGFYYLFMNKPASTFEESINNAQEITNVEKIKANNELGDKESKILTDNTEEKKSEVGKSVVVNEKEIKEIAGTNKTNSQTEEEVAPNIYYDGANYNVQVSSWKNKSVAEREAAKLTKKGFPAFIMKVYIPKFDGTWHRVRLGPFNNLTDAKKAQSKIKK